MIIDETYDKYVTIVYNWSETKRTGTTVRIYKPRHEMYSENEFYVLGIGVSNFLESDGYDPKNDWVNDSKFKDNEYEPKNIVKWLCGSNWISIDDLYELSNLLKETGAKEVYLHPSFYAVDVDDNVQECHPNTGEWLIVIPKED